MSYRRKTREELIDIMHTYQKTIDEKFPWCDINSTLDMLIKHRNEKLTEFQNGLFGTMHPSDLAECIEILKEPHLSPKPECTEPECIETEKPLRDKRRRPKA